MAIEKKRHCGFRTQFSLYLVGKYLNFKECDRLPMAIPKCACCGQEIIFNRSIRQINPHKIFGRHERKIIEIHEISLTERGIEPGMTVEGCVDKLDAMCMPPDQNHHALMYIGKQYYTIDDFVKEVKEMGFSKKIAFLPKWLKNNESIFYLARHKYMEETKGFHPKSGKVQRDGIFMTVLMTGIEYILPERERENKALMDQLVYNGIVPVFVPDDDPDHVAKKGKKPMSFGRTDKSKDDKLLPVNLEDLI